MKKQMKNRFSITIELSPIEMKYNILLIDNLTLKQKMVETEEFTGEFMGELLRKGIYKSKEEVVYKSITELAKTIVHEFFKEIK